MGSIYVLDFAMSLTSWDGLMVSTQFQFLSFVFWTSAADHEEDGDGKKK